MAIYRAKNTNDEDFESCFTCGWALDYNDNGKNYRPMMDFDSLILLDIVTPGNSFHPKY
jgi:hypothetical protein